MIVVIMPDSLTDRMNRLVSLHMITVAMNQAARMRIMRALSMDAW